MLANNLVENVKYRNLMTTLTFISYDEALTTLIFGNHETSREQNQVLYIQTQK